MSTSEAGLCKLLSLRLQELMRNGGFLLRALEQDKDGELPRVPTAGWGRPWETGTVQAQSHSSCGSRRHPKTHEPSLCFRREH